MSMAIAPSHRPMPRLAVWLALLALWLQALLPAVHHPAGAMSGLFGFGAGNLCTAPGSAPAAPQDKAPNHKPPPCPICQTFQILGAGFAPPAPIAIPLPHLRELAAHTILSITRIAERPRSRPRARAPPVPT
jgi:hypothetical protein